MKYFIDTEFLEGSQKEKFPISLFRKNTPPTIDLISIGIVREDGKEYYAISKDFNLDEAWNRYDIKPVSNIHCGPSEKVYWIRENVLRPIFYKLMGKDINFHDIDHYFTFKDFKKLINKHGKTNKQIAEEVHDFCITYDAKKSVTENNPEFYAYYADYDWVAFCWLFGKMMDLPKGFPMYCRDLKQMLDEKPVTYKVHTFKGEGGYYGSCDPYYKDWKNHVDYPKQENEHDALSDARWNKKLYEFLNSI